MCLSLSSSISIRYKIKKHNFIRNPKGGIQPVRVRYGAASLIQNDLFAVHQKAIDFLSSLGFTITKEKISRLDLQVMVEHKTSEFIKLILGDYAVRRARNDVIHRQAGEGQTYTVGEGADWELCIYDKKADLRRCIVEDPIKFKLMVEYSIGSDGYFSNRPLTCIEFRLWRTSLRFLNINSVADLRRKEKGLVDWLTINWFRLLAKPKVKGHEYDAPIHSLWIEVRAAFHRWFPGTGDDVPVEWKRPTAVLYPAPLY